MALFSVAAAAAATASSNPFSVEVWPIGDGYCRQSIAIVVCLNSVETLLIIATTVVVVVLFSGGTGGSDDDDDDAGGGGDQQWYSASVRPPLKLATCGHFALSLSSLALIVLIFPVLRNTLALLPALNSALLFLFLLLSYRQFLLVMLLLLLHTHTHTLAICPSCIVIRSKFNLI